MKQQDPNWEYVTAVVIVGLVALVAGFLLGALYE